MAASSGTQKRTWAVRILVLLALAVAFAALRLTILAPDPIEVRAVAVGRGRVESTITNSKAGTIRARRRSRLTAEIGGRVVAIARREGERVKAGEILVRLNDRSLRAQVDLAREGVHVASARHDETCLARERAARELGRMRKLAEQNIASEDVLDQLQHVHDSAAVACDAATAELQRAHASVRAADAELAKTEIVAPFDGLVAEVSTEVGEWVTPSPPLLTSPAVVDLIDPSSLYLSAPMDEVDSGLIRPGLEAKLTVDSRPDEEFAGTLRRVAPYVLDVEAQNRTVEIEAEFEDTTLAASFLPGTSADVEVVLDARENVLRVPTSSLLEGNRVLLLEDGELVERAVELGLRNWEFAEVLGGLSEGEQVVTSLDRVEIKAGAKAVALEPSPDPHS